jgi:hypothetical protein
VLSLSSQLFITVDVFLAFCWITIQKVMFYYSHLRDNPAKTCSCMCENERNKRRFLCDLEREREREYELLKKIDHYFCFIQSFSELQNIIPFLFDTSFLFD